MESVIRQIYNLFIKMNTKYQHNSFYWNYDIWITNLSYSWFYFYILILEIKLGWSNKYRRVDFVNKFQIYMFFNHER